MPGDSHIKVTENGGVLVVEFEDRKILDELSISVNTNVKHATREPETFFLRCHSRTITNVASIGLLVRMCVQCSAGNASLHRGSFRLMPHYPVPQVALRL